MVTIQDAKDHLGIDWTDAATDRRLTKTIAAAEKFLEGSLGVGYPADDPRAEALVLMVVSELYDNHDMTEKVSANVRRLVNDFSLQIRLEMRP